MPPPIAILGAGPSGLLLGRLLSLAGIDFIIFERDSSAASAWGRGGSGTLDLHEGSGQLALQEAGLLGEFKKKARYEVPLYIADMHGDVRMKHGEGEETDRPEIDRRDLRVMLLDTVPSDNIRWGVKVERVQRQDDGLMAVHFKGGEIQSGFRLVVGADGAWSKARSLVTSATPQFAGKYYLTTNISPTSPAHATVESMVGTGNYMSMGGHRMLTAMRLGDRSYYIIAGLRLPESWKSDNAALVNGDPERLRKELIRDHFSDWSEINTDMITHSDGTFYVWPLYGLPVDSLEWSPVPGVTLIGDAAHLCPPNGEGVNVALHDSLQLAQQIKTFGIDRLDEASQAYEKLMFPRARATMEDSAMMDKMMFAGDAPAGMLQAFSAALANGSHEEAAA